MQSLGLITQANIGFCIYLPDEILQPNHILDVTLVGHFLVRSGNVPTSPAFGSLLLKVLVFQRL